MAAGMGTALDSSTVTTDFEELLRLAWQVAAEGKPGTRDALLTLAVAESGPTDAVLAERCRRLLVARQPSHWFATTATLGQALTHPRVAGALAKLRAMFPPVRVQRLLMRFDAAHGPFTGARPPLNRVLRELTLAPEAPARSRPTRARLFSGQAEPDGSVEALYFAVLLAMAVLLESVVARGQSDGPDSSAADTRAA